MEDTILHTTQSLAKTGSREVGDESLVTRKIVNEFWSMAQDEALAVLRSNCVRNRLMTTLLNHSKSIKSCAIYINRVHIGFEMLCISMYYQSSCADYYLLLKVKQLVVWFCSTLRVGVKYAHTAIRPYIYIITGVWI